MKTLKCPLCGYEMAHDCRKIVGSEGGRRVTAAKRAAVRKNLEKARAAKEAKAKSRQVPTESYPAPSAKD